MAGIHLKRLFALAACSGPGRTCVAYPAKHVIGPQATGTPLPDFPADVPAPKFPLAAY